MNLIEVLLMIVILCLAPVLVIPVLTLLVLWLLMQMSVLVFQGALVLTAFAIKKVELYWKRGQETQTEEIKQIEEAKS